MDEVKLLPCERCPFCGWPATPMRCPVSGGWRVYCNDDGTCGDDAPGCCAEGPDRATEAEAIAAWNTRPTLVTDEVVERVKEAGRNILERMFSNLSNGKGVEADDGEKCWIVHSDDIEQLRAALDAMPAIPPQSLDDHALPPSGLSRDASQSETAAAIARKGDA